MTFCSDSIRQPVKFEQIFWVNFYKLMFYTDVPNVVTGEYIKHSENKQWQSKCRKENNKEGSAAESKQFVLMQKELSGRRGRIWPHRDTFVNESHQSFWVRACKMLNYPQWLVISTLNFWYYNNIIHAMHHYCHGNRSIFIYPFYYPCLSVLRCPTIS